MGVNKLTPFNGMLICDTRRGGWHENACDLSYIAHNSGSTLSPSAHADMKLGHACVGYLEKACSPTLIPAQLASYGQA